MKNTLEHSALPNPDEIKLYQEGKLDSARSHEIELIAQENPLLAEAIEGYSTSPSFHMIPVITATVAATAGSAVGASAAAGGIAAAAKIATPWWHLNGWIIGAAVGTSAAVGTYYIKENIEAKEEQQNKKQELVSQDQAQLITSEQTRADSTIAYAEAFSNADLTEKAPENVNEIAETRVSSETSSIVSDTRATTESGQKISGQPLNADQILKPSGQNINAGEGNTVSTGNEIKPSSTVAISIIKVLNYKMADYTVIRSSHWEKFSTDDIGVPANFSSEEEKIKFQKENPGKVVPYIDYITQCIRAYDEHKHKVALQRFGVVLKQYPDDVNAQFYSAMSYFDSMDYEKAIPLFQKVEKNHINTFDEEAFFYHAKCLKAQGDIDGANSLFVKVVQMNGFYRERAITEMQ